MGHLIRMTLGDYLIFIGLDPALGGATGKGDFLGIAVHVLPKKKPLNRPWLPFLVKLFKLKAGSYKTMWHNLTDPNGALYPYRSFYRMQVDYTTEKMLGDFLESKFGETRVIKTPFTKGESGSKMRLANSSLSFLKSGYAFPDHNLIEDPDERDNIRQLKKQIVNEELVLNPDGSAKFRHKGPHNDLLHGWMLSLDECLKFVLSKQGQSGEYVGSPMIEQSEINYSMGHL